MLCLSGFELYSCWVPLNHVNEIERTISSGIGALKRLRPYICVEYSNTAV